MKHFATTDVILEPPFSAECQLLRLDPPPASIPGYARVALQDQEAVFFFLEKEYCSVDLDRVASRLWWMSKQDSANISPLHRQHVKRRSIVVSQDPKLHLVWIHDRIFIKPLPRYLTSYAFWRQHLVNTSTEQNRRLFVSVLGYLRTWYYLVRSEHDFRIAQDPRLHLIPESITWEQFCRFITPLGDVSDRDVSGRYAYGEIRLTRLNFYAPVLLGKAHFQRVESQYAEYFAAFYAPILFCIGIASIILNGVQIIVSVGGANPNRYGENLLDMAFWFAVTTIICFGCLFGYLVLVLLYKIVMEWRYAIRDRIQLSRL